MTYEFKFPDVGEGITEGEIVKWHVKPGDKVKADDVLVEVETDKAIVQIPSPKTGTILKLYAEEGTIVKVGSVLVTIDDGSTSMKETVAEKKGSVGVIGSLPEYEPQQVISAAPLKTTAVSQTHVKALPAIRQLAKEKGVDLAKIAPTGPSGTITEDDVMKASDMHEQAEPAKGLKITPRDYDLYGYIQRIPLKGTRRTIAKRMLESSQKTAAVTAFDEADVSHLFEVRQKEKKFLEQEGIDLTFLPFVTKAVIAALKKHPILNAVYDEEKEEIVVKEYYNIGFAVDTADGLLVPVIKIADKKSVEDLAREMQKLAKATRERTIDLGDMKDGTFTITNIGSIGGTFGTPIINPPQVAILLTGRIQDKAIVKEGNIVIRKMLPLSLTFDHRILDGAEAAKFINDLKSYLEDPDRFLLETV